MHHVIPYRTIEKGTKTKPYAYCFFTVNSLLVRNSSSSSIISPASYIRPCISIAQSVDRSYTSIKGACMDIATKAIYMQNEQYMSFKLFRQRCHMVFSNIFYGLLAKPVTSRFNYLTRGMFKDPCNFQQLAMKKRCEITNSAVQTTLYGNCPQYDYIMQTVFVYPLILIWLVYRLS